MNRKDFLKTCGMACVSALPLSILMQGCAAPKSIAARIRGDDLIVPLSDFIQRKSAQIVYRPYVIVHHELLQYPVCVYRFSDSDYSALWMSCSHQGAELSVYGDKLVCAAHGSEFTNRGEVTGAPADKPLRRFPVQFTADHLKISLKAL